MTDDSGTDQYRPVNDGRLIKAIKDHRLSKDSRLSKDFRLSKDSRLLKDFRLSKDDRLSISIVKG